MPRRRHRDGYGVLARHTERCAWRVPRIMVARYTDDRFAKQSIARFDILSVAQHRDIHAARRVNWGLRLQLIIPRMAIFISA